MNETIVSQLHLRCSACNELKTLKDAALENWVICSSCQLIFCAKCRELSAKDSICLGSVYTQKHKPSFTMIPVEQILVLGKRLERKPKEGKFIPKIFFEDEKKKIDLLKRKMKRKETFQIIRFREEQWRKFGTVLVKRADGKFITWGQVD
ncbi:MAG: hypothetical protein ACTSSG_02090 [Candidatus Heimdallarchaeaceae archaeon]